MEPGIRVRAPIIPDLSDMLAPPKHQTNPAEWTYERLGSLIKDFEEELDDEHEVGVRLVSFGNGSVYHVVSLGYWGPDIVIFHCIAQDGAKADLIQHVSQLNFLLMAVPKFGESPSLSTSIRL